MEQTLGHVTHAQNLRQAVATQSELAVTWFPIPFELGRGQRFLPGYRNWSVRASLRARAGLARGVRTGVFDALLFHTQVTALFSAGAMRRVPSVISLDATPVNFDSVGAAYGHRPAGAGWLDALKHQMNQDRFQAAQALIAWSAWTAESLVSDYSVERERISVLAPGAAQPYFEIGDARTSRSAGEPVRLLFVGGDFARKGGPLVLEAVRAARTRVPFEVHIVTRDRVPDIPHVITHHGVGPNSHELLRQFALADAFVLPSRGECLSIALMEAAAAGLPIITTDVGALREAAVDGQSALVVPAGDVASLRAAIERLVDDREMRERLGRAGNALAHEKFDAARNNRAILGIVSSVARRFSETRSAA